MRYIISESQYRELKDQEYGDELYHYTSMENLRKIIESGKIKVKPMSLINKYSRNVVDSTDYGYISLTEDDDFHSITSDIPTDVRIVFDRDRLGDNFKLIPYSYDDEKYKSIEYDDDIDVANDEWYGDESEYRVYKNIPIKYIKCVDEIDDDISPDLMDMMNDKGISVRQF